MVTNGDQPGFFLRIDRQNQLLRLTSTAAASCSGAWMTRMAFGVCEQPNHKNGVDMSQNWSTSGSLGPCHHLVPRDAHGKFPCGPWCMSKSVKNIVIPGIERIHGSMGHPPWMHLCWKTKDFQIGTVTMWWPRQKASCLIPVMTICLWIYLWLDGYLKQITNLNN